MSQPTERLAALLAAAGLYELAAAAAEGRYVNPPGGPPVGRFLLARELGRVDSNLAEALAERVVKGEFDHVPHATELEP